MSDLPPCHACGRHFDDHETHGDTVCQNYVWPGSLQAAGVDLDRAVTDFWREVSAPLRRLVAWLERKITAITHRSTT